MNIGGFGKGLFGNDLGYKPNGAKRYIKASNDIIEIEKKMAMGLTADELSDEEYAKLAAFDKAELAAFYAEVNKLISEGERIAIKMAKGEKLTPDEEKLINEKFPDLKREAEQAKKEGEELKNRLKMAKSHEEKQQIASTAVMNVGAMANKGALSSIQAQVKLAAIEKAVQDENGEGNVVGDTLRAQGVRRGYFLSREV